MTRALDWSTTAVSNHFNVDPWANRSADEILADIAAASAELEAIVPPPSPEALEAAASLGLFALGVPCCAGADGPRIRVVALEPVTALDLGIARMKLERWHPEAAKVIELAAAGRW